MDDNRALKQLTTMTLERCGYVVSAFSSAIEALAEFRARPSSFDIVVADMTMPEMSGIAFVREVLSTRPELRCIVASSYLCDADQAEVSALGAHGLTVNPCAPRELASMLRRVLDTPP